MKIVDADAVWRALADPTRRLILERLAAGVATTGDIVERFAPTLVRTAVMKHLDVLETANLVRVERVGRTRRNHLEGERLEQVAAWLEQRVQRHQGNLKRLKNLAEAGSKPQRN